MLNRVTDWLHVTVRLKIGWFLIEITKKLFSPQNMIITSRVRAGWMQEDQPLFPPNFAFNRIVNQRRELIIRIPFTEQSQWRLIKPVPYFFAQKLGHSRFGCRKALLFQIICWSNLFTIEIIDLTGRSTKFSRYNNSQCLHLRYHHITKTFRSRSCSQIWRAHWDPGETDVEVRMEDKVLETYHKSEPWTP